MPSEVMCLKEWNTSKGQLFPIPKGAWGSITPWILSLLLENDEEEPMVDASHPFAVMYNSRVEAL